MINYYAPVVYHNAMNLSRNISLILGGCTSLVYLVGSTIPLWSMDRFGRRSALMFSAAGLCFCFAMTAILLSIGSKPCAYAATVFVFIFQLCLGVGYLPVPWLVIGVTAFADKKAADQVAGFTQVKSPLPAFVLAARLLQDL